MPRSLPQHPVLRLRTLSVCLLQASTILSQSANAQKANTFVVVGESGVSAQQLFLSNSGKKVYIIDKAENNPAQVNGHPAWATEYDLATNTYRAMDILTNSFCAGGTVLGNGTWLNVGGNNPVGYGGIQVDSCTGPFENCDGGKALRILDPCDDGDCNWIDDPKLYMTTRRWYPTLETLEDGSAIVLGGCLWGGYVNSPNQDNPTFEYWPPKGAGLPTQLNILVDSMPVNLFPLTWLLPSGNLFIQAEFKAEIFDYKSNTEYYINDIPDAVRVYPASAATAVFPMTPANNWTTTILFCGGTNLANNQWTTNWAIPSYAASASCVNISPDVDITWHYDDSLDTGRSMGQFINLPDGRLFMVNGGHKGTAGYGPESWAIGQSYADEPLTQSWYFDPTAAAGSRWSKAAVSEVYRLYHSSATLLLDGSVFVSGSNPNADYTDKTNSPTATYLTEYRVEIFYPDYYDKARPAPGGFPTQIKYGGPYWNMTLSKEDLAGDPMNILKTKAVIIRTGFSTHSMNMGQRHIELRTAFTVNADGSAVLHVSQLPPNPAILAPGTAAFFIVVDGVPSQGSMVMIGDGIIGTHKTIANAELPMNSMPENASWKRRWQEFGREKRA
ncbi:hypothetical protein QFC22_000896 [Naganishia vaughanmartiniae]|uniref:Uncharacterized protein n=1 Tax=Naganishia vaughanmartiniae TaxID=1424756 RepID=A0ACC2XKC5_9TREE|nr:hypothetical protein QFC22_000896 [Naganishia vaughanmartiniae]